MESDIKKWIEKDGEAFLKDIGIKKGQKILDFGCGVGNYAIPAAKLVGESGKVYALDKNEESLNELSRRIKKRGIRNIERIETSEKEIPLQDESVDAVLLYDVIHLVNDREKLLKEIYRILKPNSLLLVYPKHHQEYMNMGSNDIENEMEDANFIFEKRIYKTLMHDAHLEEGYVLNFRKLLN